MPHSYDSLVITIKPETEYRLCAVAMLCDMLHNITITEVAYFRSSSTTHHFSFLNEVMLVLIPPQKCICYAVITYSVQVYFCAREPYLLNLSVRRIKAGHIIPTTSARLRNTISLHKY
jgi:hypothetical protein